ncbi:MAG: hypothetical protein FH749_05550 [Firmicutes bacterium]|nr:hypothetical protein [Bacillota bacterium]
MDFKLISVAVALAILGLGMAVVAPVGVDLAAVLSAEQAAERLARELQHYQQLAVAQNTTFEFAFFPFDNCYVIKDLSGQYPVAQTIWLPAGVEFDYLSYQHQVRYHPSGRASQNGRISLTHENWQGNVQIIIANHSGRVRVQR